MNLHLQAPAPPKNPPRLESASHSPERVSYFADAAARRGTTTIQSPAGSRRRFRRKISRRRRRNRDRSTADPALRVVMTPMRAPSVSDVASALRTMSRPCRARPCSRTAANSTRRVRRAAFGNVSAPIEMRKTGANRVKRRCAARNESQRPWATGACARAGGDVTGWRDRPWFSSGRGSHAGVCAYASKVDKFFS